MTGARIRLFLPDGTLAQEGYCDRAKRNPSLTFSPRSNIPDGSRLVVCYAMHFDDGVSVVCPLGAEAPINGLQAPNQRPISQPQILTPQPVPGNGRGQAETARAPFEGQFDARAKDPEVGRDSPILLDPEPMGDLIHGAAQPAPVSADGSSVPLANPLVEAGRVQTFLRRFGDRVLGRRRR